MLKTGCAMIYKTYTVVFEGVEARCIEVQCALSVGLPGFSIVGLPNKAVSEARDRVRSALASMSIALALLAAIGIISQDACENAVSLGELSLDRVLVPVRGALPAAVTAAASDRVLICPTASGPEAAWVEQAQIIGADSLWHIIQYVTARNRSLWPAKGTLRPP